MPCLIRFLAAYKLILIRVSGGICLIFVETYSPCLAPCEGDGEYPSLVSNSDHVRAKTVVLFVRTRVTTRIRTRNSSNPYGVYIARPW